MIPRHDITTDERGVMVSSAALIGPVVLPGRG
jgi:hypothetical protein